MAAFGDGGGDAGDGGAEGGESFLQLFRAFFLLRGALFDLLTIGFDEGLQVGGILEEEVKVFDDGVFEGAGGDGFEGAIAVAFGAGAGVAIVVGA